MEERDGLTPQYKEAEKLKTSRHHVQAEAEFWKGVEEVRDRRGSLTREQASFMYEIWKRQTIQSRQQERALQVLREAGIAPENALPKSIIGIDASARRGSVVYEDLDSLIKDMESYFVLPSTLDAYTVAKDQIISAAGPDVAEHMNSHIKPFTDAGIMKRLDDELRIWNEHGAQGRFGDSQSTDYGGDTYKYTGALFTGHEIGAYKDESGKYHLILEGAGYSFNETNPTSKIEDFAAFVDRDVVYEGPVDLTYVAAPPEQPVIKKREDATPSAFVDLSVKDVADHIGHVVGLTSEQKQAFIRETSVKPEDSDVERPVVAKGMSIVLKVRYGRGDITTYDETNEQIHFETPARISEKSAEGENDNVSFFLPRLYVNIKGETPEATSKAVKIFRAIETISRDKVNKDRKNDMIRPDTWYYSTDRKPQSPSYS